MIEIVRDHAHRVERWSSGDMALRWAAGMTAPSGTPVAVDVSRDRRSRVIWVALLAGSVIWFVHLTLVYMVTEAGCTGGGPGSAAVRSAGTDRRDPRRHGPRGDRLPDGRRLGPPWLAAARRPVRNGDDR
jgi:hypothetical protein